jgi:hypothetical protein
MSHNSSEIVRKTFILFIHFELLVKAPLKHHPYLDSLYSSIVFLVHTHSKTIVFLEFDGFLCTIEEWSFHHDAVVFRASANVFEFIVKWFHYF